MAITFYDYTPAPSPRRARILLAEKGITVENVQIDMGKAEQLTEEYKEINPGCTIPALKLGDGTILTENAGIAAWAEAYQAEPPLLGTTAEEKGLVANWNAKMEFEGLMAAAEALRNSSPGMVDRATTGPVNYAQIPELAARGKERLGHFMDMLNERLEGRRYIATDQFTVADITAMVVVDFAKWVKVVPGGNHANLKRWHAEVSARPSAKA
jgi:glutathione S-transferase